MSFIKEKANKEWKTFPMVFYDGAQKKQDSIYLKQNAAKELGYKYEIWVYDRK